MEAVCKICNSKLFVHDTSLVLNKHSVTYYYCSHCGFVQTEEPYWLEEAYSKAIATADTGIISRNLKNANDLLYFIHFIHCQNEICMDFGGGHGILTRIMRDYGFDFYHYDKYANNLYAQGFEANMNNKYKLITAYENFEHFTTPLIEIEKLMRITDVLFFSTSLVSSPPPLIKDWWYYSPSTGQHISFYTLKTLQVIADKFDCQLLSDNSDLHILSKSPIRKNFFEKLRAYNKIRNKLDITGKFKQKSKIWDDYLAVTDSIR